MTEKPTVVVCEENDHSSDAIVLATATYSLKQSFKAYKQTDE